MRSEAGERGRLSPQPATTDEMATAELQQIPCHPHHPPTPLPHSLKFSRPPGRGRRGADFCPKKFQLVV